jgi:uncharacterized spore protein YtfJ
MDVATLMEKGGGSLNAGRVFSEPITQDGVTVVLAAKVAGGGGGSEGQQQAEEQQGLRSGTGGGFGLGAKPAGAFVLKEGVLHWRPAVDLNRVIFGAQAVVIAALGALSTVLTARHLSMRRPRRRILGGRILGFL